jgi:hypothetical protein
LRIGGGRRRSLGLGGWVGHAVTSAALSQPLGLVVRDGLADEVIEPGAARKVPEMDGELRREVLGPFPRAQGGLRGVGLRLRLARLREALDLGLRLGSFLSGFVELALLVLALPLDGGQVGVDVRQLLLQPRLRLVLAVRLSSSSAICALRLLTRGPSSGNAAGSSRTLRSASA